jgi:protein-disulfide isomerase
MLDLGPNSTQAAIAAECAGEQGQYWQMHDLLFANQRDIYGANNETFQTLAAELGLETGQFGACLAEQRYADLVQSQDQTRRQSGIRTRPTFDISGQLLIGAQGFDAFQARIDPLLAQ